MLRDHPGEHESGGADGADDAVAVVRLRGQAFLRGICPPERPDGQERLDGRRFRSRGGMPAGERGFEGEQQQRRESRLLQRGHRPAEQHPVEQPKPDGRRGGGSGTGRRALGELRAVGQPDLPPSRDGAREHDQQRGVCEREFGTRVPLRFVVFPGIVLRRLQLLLCCEQCLGGGETAGDGWGRLLQCLAGLARGDAWGPAQHAGGLGSGIRGCQPGRFPFGVRSRVERDSAEPEFGAD